MTTVRKSQVDKLAHGGERLERELYMATASALCSAQEITAAPVAINLGASAD